MKRTWLAVIFAGAMAAGLAALAADDKAKDDKPKDASHVRSTDEAAVRAASASLARAFEKGDAKAVAAFWTDEGEYVDEQREAIHGRAALEKAYAGFFAKRPEVKVEGTTHSVRFLGKDTAIEEGTIKVHAKDEAAKTSRYSSLYVRQDGHWLVALLKEWDQDDANRPSLDDLAWLIGEWKSESGDVDARTTYEWTENKKFIRSKYSVTNKKDKAAPGTGTQVIGIDPALGVIRTWTFDSEGGVGEARWSYDGQRWAIESAGTLADGSSTTAINLLTRVGNDEFTWRSVKRTLEGEELPDLAAVHVKRVKSGK